MMLRPFSSEQGNFSLFMVLVVLSAYLFTLPHASFWASGGAMMLWGAFGFWRLAVISFYDGRSTKIASLPARLMATLDEREHKLRQHGHSRLHHLDIQIWFALGCAYALWVGINFLSPVPVAAMADLQLSLNDFWQDVGGQGPEIKLGGNGDMLVRQVSFLFCLGVAAFTVHSFSYNENFIRQAGLVILPVFVICAGAVAAGGLLHTVPVPSTLTWRGAGSGAAHMLGAMLPDTPQNPSFFMRRLIEQGMIGAGLVLLLYVVPTAGLVRFMVRSGRKAVTLSALAVLAVVVGIDVMGAAGGLGAGVLFMGAAYLALAWGHSAYLRPYWYTQIEEELQGLTEEQI